MASEFDFDGLTIRRLDSTGARGLTVVVRSRNGASVQVHDNHGNSYTYRGEQFDDAGVGFQLWDVENPTVGSNHEVTVIGGSITAVIPDRDEFQWADQYRNTPLPLRAASASLQVIESITATDKVDANVVRGPTAKRLRIEQDCDQLLLLATSLGQMARTAIANLDNDSRSRNDPDTIGANQRQRDVLQIFAEGFEQLAGALAAFCQDRTKPLLLGKAAAVVDDIAKKFNAWWDENGAEAIGWTIKIPGFVAGLGLLGLFGDVTPAATMVLAALVGGKSVVDALRKGQE